MLGRICGRVGCLRWWTLHLRMRGSLLTVEWLVRRVRICRLRRWALGMLRMASWNEVGACAAKMLRRLLLRVLHRML